MLNRNASDAVQVKYSLLGKEGDIGKSCFELAQDMREFVIKPLEEEKERLRKAIGATGWKPELQTEEQIRKVVYEREYKALTKLGSAQELPPYAP